MPLVWTVAAICSPTQLTRAAIFASVSILLGSLLSSSGPVDRWTFFTTRAIVVATIWLTVVQWRKRAAAEERERQALIAQHELELKTLRGIIPICAWCKKIRADSGVWKRIEQYVNEHSGAEFSHSVCSECVLKVNEQELSPGQSKAAHPGTSGV